MISTYRFTEAGTRHRLCGMPNQDASVVEAHGGYALSFVADGMGSARLGGEAAAIAVQNGYDMACRTLLPIDGIDPAFGDALVRGAFAAAYNAIRSSAAEEGELNEMLTTFMAMCFDEHTGRLHYGYCGDGGILAIDSKGRLKLAARPRKGSTHSETASLFEHETWEFGCLEDVCAFAVLTDGMFDALCPEGALDGSAHIERAVQVMCVPLAVAEGEPRESFDRAFSEDGVHDGSAFGRLFADVGDDRTVVVVASDALGGISEVTVANEGEAQDARVAGGTPQQASARKPAAAAPAQPANGQPAAASAHPAGTAPDRPAAAAPAAGNAAPAARPVPALRDVVPPVTPQQASEARSDAYSDVAPLTDAEIIRVRTLLACCTKCVHVKRELRASSRTKREARYANAR